MYNRFCVCFPQHHVSLLIRHVAPLLFIDYVARAFLEPMLVLTRGAEFCIWLMLVRLFDVDVVFYGASRRKKRTSETAVTPWNLRVADIAQSVGEWLLLRFVWFPLNSFFAVLLLDHLGETPCMSCRIRPELFMPLPIFVQAIRRFFVRLFRWHQESSDEEDTGTPSVQEMSTRWKRSRFKTLNFSDELEEKMKRKLFHRRYNRLMKPAFGNDEFY